MIALWDTPLYSDFCLLLVEVQRNILVFMYRIPFELQLLTVD